MQSMTGSFSHILNMYSQKNKVMEILLYSIVLFLVCLNDGLLFESFLHNYSYLNENKLQLCFVVLRVSCLRESNKYITPSLISCPS